MGPTTSDNGTSGGTRPGGSLIPSRLSGASAGSREVWVEVPDPGGRPAAWCYTDQKAFSRGDSVDLRISATVDRLRVRVRRDHGAREVIFDREVDVAFQQIPERAYEVGCGWDITVSFPVPEAAGAGVYLVELWSALSAAATPLGHHLFVVHPDAPRPEALALFLATTTWTAYNDWGGANHYFGENAGVTRGRSPILSTQRPWARGQVWLPDGTPRVVNPVRPRRPENARYSSVEWAALNGYSKYYASSGWATYEKHFVDWAEAAGYAVDIYTHDDLHSGSALLGAYRCLGFIGHDEYWTSRMRDAVDRYVDDGGRVVRLAGNFMWQIRLEEDSAQQVAYKYEARQSDPMAATDPAAITGAWEDPWVGRPGASTFGLNALRGLYAAWGGMAPRAARGFVVFRHKHWAFEGTGLGYADMIGDEVNVFGYEVDGLEYTFRDGLPFPTHEDGAPETLEILAMNWATSAEYGLPEHADSHMLGDGDARYMAEICGDSGEEAIERRARTSGMVVSFTRGKGEVFTAGACEWVNGLKERDHYIEAITKNVLSRFLTSDGPSAALAAETA